MCEHKNSKKARGNTYRKYIEDHQGRWNSLNQKISNIIQSFINLSFLRFKNREILSYFDIGEYNQKTKHNIYIFLPSGRGRPQEMM